jgi:hypothetical protein
MNKGTDLVPCCDPHFPLVGAFRNETNNKEKFCFEGLFCFVLHGMQYLYIFAFKKSNFFF